MLPRVPEFSVTSRPVASTPKIDGRRPGAKAKKVACPSFQIWTGQGLVARPGTADVARPCGYRGAFRAARARLGIAQHQPVGRIAGAPLADRQRDRAPPGIDRHVGLGPGDPGFHGNRGPVREDLDLEGLAVAEKDGNDPLSGAQFDGGVHAEMRVEPDDVDGVVENRPDAGIGAHPGGA